MIVRIRLIASLGFVVALLSSAPAQAGLTICNRVDRAISVSLALVGYYEGGPSKKIANFFGWYGVAPGECRMIRHISGDNAYNEVTNGLVKVENGMASNPNGAMYLFVKDDQGHVWDGIHSRLSSQRQGEPVGDRRDDNGYVWPNTLDICSPTGHSPPDIASVDFLDSAPLCSRVSYLLINPKYFVEFQLDVQ
jgi:Protein of unknown function (DUF1036)